MAASESVRFQIIGDDRASDAFSRVGRATGEMLAKMDKAAFSSALLDDALRRQTETAKRSADASLSLARTDKTLADAELLLSGAANEAAKNLRQQGRDADGAAAKTKLAGLSAAGAGSGFGALGGAGGMGAVIAAGVALSPVLATLGAGLGGFGLAAYSVTKNSALMGKELAPLKTEFAGFSASLQPEVLTDFGKGVTIARNVLHDLQPVAAATGKALGGVLDQIGAEFRSQSWQNFFGFMARTAGPDLQMVGGLFTSLAADLPPLLTGLQPVASEMITLATGAANAVGVLEQLAGRITSVASAAVKAAEVQSGSTGPGDTLTNPWKDFTNFLSDATRAIPGASRLVTALGGGVTEAGIAAANAGAKVDGMGASAKAAAAHVQTLAQMVTGLTGAENNAISPLLAYSNALIAQKNDAGNLNAALKTSHDRIGLSTAAQRQSFSAANTYIQDLLTTSSAAVKSHQGIDAQISSLKGALPQLQSVKGGTRQYWQEVQQLVSWLHKLEQQKQIYENVFITGKGTWSVGGTTGLKAAAAGMYVNAGTSPVADDVIARVSRGELVVPAKMVSAGLVDHLRGSIPGFAQGGYAGPLKGLQPWASSSYEASIRAITAGIAGGMARQLTASASAGGAGVARWAPVILQALAMLGQSPANLGAVEHRIAQESGGNPFAINLWDINAKRGDPSRGLMQVIGATFARYRSFALPNDIYSPLANIFAGLNYAVNAYPGRSLSSVMLQAGGYDSGGYLPPGASIAYNGTGKPERVGGPAVVNYNITVRADASAHGPDIGRAIVERIRQFEKRSGKSWRS